MSAPEWLVEHVERSHEMARKIRAAGAPYVSITLTFGAVDDDDLHTITITSHDAVDGDAWDHEADEVES